MKRIPHLYLVALLGMLCGAPVFGQDNAHPPEDFLKTVVPPSPNAASLGKYGAWPVNLYTGTPEISVPLHEAATQSIKIPIALSYHASGIRVGEVASWVGLGWSMQAGGVITRTIRGLPDDEINLGYFATRQDYTDPNDLSTWAPEDVWKTDLIGAAQGSVDTEQDVYVINALGKTYKLLFRGDGTILTMPHSNVVIKADFLHDLWHVYLEDGTKLTFGGQGEYSERSTVAFGTVAGMLNFASSWYLRKIESPTRETVNFAYTRYGMEQEANYVQSDWVQTGGNCLPWTESSVQTSYNPLTVGALLLTTIDTDLERIEFVPVSTEREDLKGGRALSEVKIFSKFENKYVDKFIFHYLYSTAASSNRVIEAYDPTREKRLKLMSVERNVANSDNLQVWSFEYNPEPLPGRTSTAQDHWGYYNGATSNLTLLPQLDVALPGLPFTAGFMPPAHDVGANREGKEKFMKAEMLTKIIYPTKGYTRFNYEANKLPATEEEYRDSTLSPERIQLMAGTTPFITQRTMTFYVAMPQSISLLLAGTISGPFDIGEGVHIYAYVTNDALQDFGGLQDNGYMSFYVSDPGYYKLMVSTNVDASAMIASTSHVAADVQVTFRYKKPPRTFFKPVGGVRILSMIDSAGETASQNISRYFTYENPLVLDPIVPNRRYFSKHVTEPCGMIKYTRSSDSKFSLGSVQGGSIGYGKVTTRYGASKENGYTVTIFSNEQDNGVEMANDFPYPPATALDWRRGLTRMETQYTRNDIPLSRTINDYYIPTIATIHCYKAGYWVTKLPQCYDDPYQICEIQRASYDIVTQQVQLLSTTAVNYTQRQSKLDSAYVITRYYYDNPANTQAVRIENTDSKNKTVKNLIRTPLEKTSISGLTSTAVAALDSMIKRNMISPVIESQQLVNGTLLKRTLSNYKQTGKQIQPENTYVQVNNGPFEKKAQFVYDDYGNLIEQSQPNDVVTAYVWGYKGTLLLAEVKNATRQDLINVLSQNTLNALNNAPGTEAQIRQTLQALRTAASLKKAQITTLTHRPAVGVSTVTDANGQTRWYEYDDFNRLRAIKDFNGYALKTYEYHFKQ